MPAFELTESPAPLRRFDIVGQHSDEVPKFVEHVALFQLDNRDVKHDDAVDVVHMRPPFRTRDDLCVHLAGRVPLTIDEIRSIETWIVKVEDELASVHAQPLKQFRIEPPWRVVRDENTRAVRKRQYSCAGFVLHAYLQVDVSLLVIDQQTLPEVTRQTLEAVYPGQLENPKLRERFGIPGDGPWRVVLAGYVLHALDRSEDEIRAEPYLVQAGDELFPT